MGKVGSGISSGISTAIITSKISFAPFTPPGILIKYSLGCPTLPSLHSVLISFCLPNVSLYVVDPHSVLLVISSTVFIGFLFVLLTSVSVFSVPEFLFGSLPNLQCHFVLVSGSHIKSLASILLCIVSGAVL